MKLRPWLISSLWLGALASVPALAAHTGQSNDNEESTVQSTPQGDPGTSSRRRGGGTPHQRERTRGGDDGPAGDVVTLPSIDVERKAESGSRQGDAAPAADATDRSLADFIKMGSPETGTKPSQKDQLPLGPFTVGGKMSYGLISDGGVKVGPTADIDKLAQQPNADTSLTQNGDPRTMTPADLQRIIAGQALARSIQAEINGEKVRQDAALQGCSGGA